VKQYGPIRAFNRREFLLSAAVLPLLTGVSRADISGGGERRVPPYLALGKFIFPGSDEFPGEKTAFEIRAALAAAFASKELPVSGALQGISPLPVSYRALGPDLSEAVFASTATDVGRTWRRWIESLGEIRRSQFYVLPENVIRYEVASKREGKLEYRVGAWRLRWESGKVTEFAPVQEHLATARENWFRDATAEAFRGLPVFTEQLARGVPYWRARLDPASGIDVYGSNGIAAGDIDGDGADEVYVCQPGGLPNRLLKFGPDGAVSDITKRWGVDLLDDTSCALFLDLRNTGRQDLVVLRSSGPVLFLNDGGRCRLRTDAFQFQSVPKGGFTGMAAADFDRDGKLDLYLCCYVYFQSEAQYTYAAPYHDARNGPPNFLFRNQLNADGSGGFEDCTTETGMMENNDRFSFAPAWCDYNGDGWPDLYVANDFGRKNLYRNVNGRFHDVAAEAGVEDIGPGMSAAWFDYDHDGKPDLYVANMWTEAGQRIVRDEKFGPASKAPEAYRAHTMGNSLFQNRGDGSFEDVTAVRNVGFGRWAWSSGGHDFDNDGNAEILVTCGMLTNQSKTDLSSFFWRQVVARSPVTATPAEAYENGWNAINQFLREEYSWNGREPNVLHVRRGERYFDFSGVSGIDFTDDSRAFAVFDFDGDGRPDIVLKSRLGPQVRLLQNNCASSNHSIAFRLRGTKSNRDAVGARIQVDGQTRWLEAGSGFLSQHTKSMLFGLGQASPAKQVSVTWPSGLVQEFSNLEGGRSYFVTEGSAEVRSEPFREHRMMAAKEIASDNELTLHDTWFLEPVPLPTKQRGPGLFVIEERTDEYEIFRRYLFDWRTSLRTPFALLLNEAGEAVKVYAAVPSQQTVKDDLGLLQSGAGALGLPFDGFYVKPPKRDFFKFGVAFLWAGFPDQALPYLEKVLQQTPDNARVLVLVGQLHFQANRVEEARKSYRQAAELDPNSVNAFLGLGDVASKNNDQTEAAKYYGTALQLSPHSAEAANGLGLALAKQGQFEQARSYFEQAISARRDYPEAINNLGVLYTQQGKLEDAAGAFSYGIRVAPDEDILYLNLGKLYARAGRIDRARGIMQQLLERKPDDATARRALQELNGH
jgi:Flp pilus assembly protein TadD